MRAAYAGFFVATATMAAFGLTHVACKSASADDCHPLADVGQGAPGTLCGPRSVTLPVSAGFGAPVVGATVNGASAQILIDTGSSAPLIYSAKRLGVASDTWVTVGTLCFGDTCLRDVQAYAQDSPFSTDAANDVNGFVGEPILSNLSLEIDHMQTVTLSLGPPGSPSCSTGASYDFTLDATHRPMIAASIDGAPFPAPVLLDTGGTYTVLDPSTASALGAELASTQAPAPLCTVNGCEADAGFVATAKSVCIADRCALGSTVKYPLWNALGDTYFSSFHVAFDFARSKIIFCE